MSGRELYKEWIGRTAKSAVPWPVEERLLERAGGKCQGPCHQAIGIGNGYEIDHIVPLKDWLGEGHGNRESNLQLLCKKVCHKSKTRIEAIGRAVSARKRKHLNGKRVSKHPIPGSKASGWARRYDKHKGGFVWVRRITTTLSEYDED